jgi:glycosyltransferase involved in cell wall biosynthesis
VKKALIVQTDLSHYRLRLFALLKEKLRGDVELHLVHGARDAVAEDLRERMPLPWATEVRGREIRAGWMRLLWQPYARRARPMNLVIVTQENRLLMNYWLLGRRPWTGQKVAFWGHGRNFQSGRPRGACERWKRYWLGKADWWFAYTDLTRRILLEQGYPAERITVLDNAVDTFDLMRWSQDVGEHELRGLRANLGIASDHVAVFCGALQVYKRIPFLLEAAALVRKRISDFELVLIGTGPDESLVETAAQRHRWLHYVGPRHDRDKVRHLKLGRVFLMPGGVGLAILDAFALQLPLVTTDCGTHGPEICYLKQGENGWMTEDDPAAYSRAVADLLQDRVRLDRFRDRCLADARHYSLENMAQNFADGIRRALATEVDDGTECGQHMDSL